MIPVSEEKDNIKKREKIRLLSSSHFGFLTEQLPWLIGFPESFGSDYSWCNHQMCSTLNGSFQAEEREHNIGYT